jgi:hypothetical protein
MGFSYDYSGVGVGQQHIVLIDNLTNNYGLGTSKGQLGSDILRLIVQQAPFKHDCVSYIVLVRATPLIKPAGYSAPGRLQIFTGTCPECLVFS